MVKLKIEQAKLMKTLVDAMVAVAVEVAIEISESGFRAQAKDEATTWIVDAHINKSKFSEFEVTEKVTFLIDLKDFSDFIKTTKSNDTLEIRDNKSDGTLDLELSSNEISKNISLRLRDASDYKFMRIIDRQFHSSAEIDAEVFLDAIKAAELGDEHVTITHTKEHLHFEARSTTRTAHATIKYINSDRVRNVVFESGKYHNKKTNAEEDIPQVHEATYGLRYLKHISKIGKSGQPVKFSMSNQAPLRIAFDIDDDKMSYLAFAIAPRMREQMD